MNEALRAAAQVTDSIGSWNAETLEGLRRSRVTMLARALMGDQVTNDPSLAAAKLADLRIEVPPLVYVQVSDAYAAASGRSPPGRVCSYPYSRRASNESASVSARYANVRSPPSRGDGHFRVRGFSERARLLKMALSQGAAVRALAP